MSREEMPGPNNDLTPEDRELMDHNLWAIKALEKAQSFLMRIDPDLEVEIREKEISPTGGKPYRATVLTFIHKTNLNIRWNQEIERTDDFINNRLETVIRKVYAQEVKDFG